MVTGGVTCEVVEVMAEVSRWVRCRPPIISPLPPMMLSSADTACCCVWRTYVCLLRKTVCVNVNVYVYVYVCVYVYMYICMYYCVLCVFLDKIVILVKISIVPVSVVLSQGTC
jgi:hypothetical protein